MKKLINGIINFKKNLTPEYKQTFARLALGQSPDALFVTCSDSRVAPNLFASTDPGDLFVLRNVGNLIPPCNHEHGHAHGCESAAAAIEYAVLILKVSNIIVCGHSECGAMQSIYNNLNNISSPNLKEWLQNGSAPHLNELGLQLDKTLAPHNLLSQLNVLEQIKHLQSYPIIRKLVLQGKLKLNGWWFDIANLEVFAYNENLKKFVVIDENFI